MDARLIDSSSKKEKDRGKFSARPHSTMASGLKKKNKAQKALENSNEECKPSNPNFSFSVSAAGKDNMTFRNINDN